jgi:hypothetical protein
MEHAKGNARKQKLLPISRSIAGILYRILLCIKIWLHGPQNFRTASITPGIGAAVIVQQCRDGKEHFATLGKNCYGDVTPYA